MFGDLYTTKTAFQQLDTLSSPPSYMYILLITLTASYTCTIFVITQGPRAGGSLP